MYTGTNKKLTVHKLLYSHNFAYIKNVQSVFCTKVQFLCVQLDFTNVEERLIIAGLSHKELCRSM